MLLTFSSAAGGFAKPLLSYRVLVNAGFSDPAEGSGSVSVMLVKMEGLTCDVYPSASEEQGADDKPP